jgi:antitoxin component YwqK of YwqJK toxin-antitoxin module
MKKAMILALMFLGLMTYAQQVDVTYYDNGNVETTIYSDGDVTERVSYYKNGNIKEVASYLKGVPHGKWQIYDKKENLVSEGSFNHGKKSGVWFEFNRSTKKTYKITYINDVQVGSEEWARSKD